MAEIGFSRGRWQSFPVGAERQQIVHRISGRTGGAIPQKARPEPRKQPFRFFSNSISTAGWEILVRISLWTHHPGRQFPEKNCPPTTKLVNAVGKESAPPKWTHFFADYLNDGGGDVDPRR